MEIILNLYISVGAIVIFTLLTLPIHEQAHCVSPTSFLLLYLIFFQQKHPHTFCWVHNRRYVSLGPLWILCFISMPFYLLLALESTTTTFPGCQVHLLAILLSRDNFSIVSLSLSFLKRNHEWMSNTVQILFLFFILLIGESILTNFQMVKRALKK